MKEEVSDEKKSIPLSKEGLYLHFIRVMNAVMKYHFCISYLGDSSLSAFIEFI